MELQSYASCEFSSRDSVTQSVYGLYCGDDQYGDCAYAGYSGDSFLMLECPRYVVGKLQGSSSSGSVIDGVVLTRLDRFSQPVTESGSLVVFRTPDGPVSVDVEGLQQLAVLFVAGVVVFGVIFTFLRALWHRAI